MANVFLLLLLLRKTTNTEQDVSVPEKPNGAKLWWFCSWFLPMLASVDKQKSSQLHLIRPLLSVCQPHSKFGEKIYQTFCGRTLYQNQVCTNIFICWYFLIFQGVKENLFHKETFCSRKLIWTFEAAASFHPFLHPSWVTLKALFDPPSSPWLPDGYS